MSHLAVERPLALCVCASFSCAGSRPSKKRNKAMANCRKRVFFSDTRGHLKEHHKDHSGGIKVCLRSVTMASLHIIVGKKLVRCIYLNKLQIWHMKWVRKEGSIDALHGGLTPESTNTTCDVAQSSFTAQIPVANQLCMAQPSVTKGAVILQSGLKASLTRPSKSQS